MQKNLIVFAVLAITQVISWGAVGILPVLASSIAGDLGIALPTVFFGASTMFVTMGLAAPAAGRAFRRYGARRVMAAGAALVACGLTLIAASVTTLMFLAAWVIMGAAGAMLLTTGAYIYLSDFAEEQARSLIGTLMLVTGLSSALFFPVTAFLASTIGWRGAVLTYAGVMLLVVAPLVFGGLPETATAPKAAEPSPAPSSKGSSVFWLIVLAVALNSFVTFGSEAICVELFRAFDMSMTQAVGLAALVGVFRVGGRVIDVLGGRRWDGLSTAQISGAMIPLGLLLLCLGRAELWSIGGYLLLFGAGSGAFAVARATMPLVFYRKADYAAAMSSIALPLNLTNALAPPALAALLTTLGPSAVLGLLAALSSAAFLLIVQLGRLREPAAVTQAER